jgi:hypothetical protein
MHHEVIPRPCKIYDWLLNLSLNHFGLHQGENIIVTTEFEVPYKHNLRHALSTHMVQRVLRWERQNRCYGRKRQGPMVEKCYYNKFLMKFYLRKRRWIQEKTREWSNSIFFPFKTAFFGYIFKK